MGDNKNNPKKFRKVLLLLLAQGKKKQTTDKQRRDFALRKKKLQNLDLIGYTSNLEIDDSKKWKVYGVLKEF